MVDDSLEGVVEDGSLLVGILFLLFVLQLVQSFFSPLFFFLHLLLSLVLQEILKDTNILLILILHLLIAVELLFIDLNFFKIYFLFIRQQLGL